MSDVFPLPPFVRASLDFYFENKEAGLVITASLRHMPHVPAIADTPDVRSLWSLMTGADLPPGTWQPMSREAIDEYLGESSN